MSEAPVRGDIRAIVLIAYVLYLLAVVNGITLLVGAILLYVKRDEARGTMWDGHVRNLLQVFWVVVAVTVFLVAIILSLVVFGLVATNGHPPDSLLGGLFVLVPLLWLIVAGLTIWFFYRTIRGFIRALDGKAY